MVSSASLVRCVQFAHASLHVHIPDDDITIVACRCEYVRFLTTHAEDVVLVQAIPPVFRDYVITISVVAVLCETTGPAANDDTPHHEVDTSHLSNAQSERERERERVLAGSFSQMQYFDKTALCKS
jgi:hypothetical protein